MNVRDAMTDATHVVTVTPETTLKLVAELMMEHGISGLPVVDAGGRVLGVVSEADIVSGETGGTGREGLIARARALGDPAAVAIPRTAGEAMSSPAVTVGPDETLMHAAHRIANRGVNRLPVVDESETLVGIVTRADVVSAFARSDEQVADGIREALQRLLGIGSETVQVAVADGEVILSGDVDTEANAELAAFFASRLPGVVAVRSDLRASDDSSTVRTAEADSRGGGPVMIVGYSVTPDAARRLVASLIRPVDPDPDSLSAAAAISRAVNEDGGLVGLDDDERDAVLAALDDDGGDPPLAELRAGLMKDFRQRQGLH